MATPYAPVPFVVVLLQQYVTSPDQLLIDVGCGPALYRDATVGTYIGVDHATDRYRDMPRDVDVVASAENLPFDDANADVIMTVSTFYQFPDTRAVLHEFHRVLKPRGRVLLIDYNRRAQRRLEKIERSPRPKWTALGLCRRVRQAGFEDARLLLPEERQPHGLRRLERLALEELRGQWAIVTAVRPP